MNFLFYNCSSLENLLDILILKLNNVKKSPLLLLPDISKRNTSNINNMSFLFYDWSLLISLSVIYKWNIINADWICSFFSKRNSAKSFLDISKWNTII